MKNNKYDVFISYRRDPDLHFAERVRDKLTEKGFSVFLDYHDLGQGEFPKEIINAIINTKFFLLIISRDSLNRCWDEADFVRTEIITALKHNKKIIPVTSNENYTLNNLPDAIAQIKNLNQVIIHNDQFDASVERIVDFIEDRPHNIQPQKCIFYKPILYWVISIIAFIAWGYGLFQLGGFVCRKSYNDPQQMIIHTYQKKYCWIHDGKELKTIVKYDAGELFFNNKQFAVTGIPDKKITASLDSILFAGAIAEASLFKSLVKAAKNIPFLKKHKYGIILGAIIVGTGFPYYLGKHFERKKIESEISNYSLKLLNTPETITYINKSLFYDFFTANNAIDTKLLQNIVFANINIDENKISKKWIDFIDNNNQQIQQLLKRHETDPENFIPGKDDFAILLERYMILYVFNHAVINDIPEIFWQKPIGRYFPACFDRMITQSDAKKITILPMIEYVGRDTQADKLGLHAGDIILSMNLDNFVQKSFDFNEIGKAINGTINIMSKKYNNQPKELIIYCRKDKQCHKHLFDGKNLTGFQYCVWVFDDVNWLLKYY